MPDATSRRIIAIGDIHGCVNALEGILDAVEPRSDDLLVVLGDFIDQGCETRLVIDCLIELQDRCELVCLTGNHEEMLLAAKSSEAALRHWEVCGGVQTLNSYRFGGTLADIPDDHWEFIRGCRRFFETAEHIFVHANLDPKLPLESQEDYTLRWELLVPETVQRHCSGKTAIVGHTEQTSGEVLDLGCIQCIDTACWRYGWLTALEVSSNQIWQASRFGQMREAGELSIGPTGPRR